MKKKRIEYIEIVYDYNHRQILFGIFATPKFNMYHITRFQKNVMKYKVYIYI